MRPESVPSKTDKRSLVSNLPPIKNFETMYAPTKRKIRVNPPYNQTKRNERMDKERYFL
jgi:hypothetical protein